MAKKYKKSTTHYVKKQLDTVTNSGNIYEVDYSTLINTNLGYPSTNSEGNFKIVSNNEIGSPKKYGTGNWIESTNEEDKEIWTLDDLDDVDEDNGEEVKPNTKRKREMVLSKDFTLLSSFAYYGSLVELIESSITDIITRFPASLWLVDNRQFNNNFAIDLHTSVASNTDPLKVMESNYEKYEIIETKPITYKLKCGSEIYEINNLSVEDAKPITTAPIRSYNANNGLLETVQIGGKTLYYNYNENCVLINITVGSPNPTLPPPEDYPPSSIHIRPKQEYIDEFFDSLDDFQKTLLNQYTNPRYTSTFRIPKESEDFGIYFADKTFTWSTTDGWNLDLDSVAFNDYLTELLDAAEYLDNFRTDIIYRMMTHETIKNIDSNSYFLDENDIDLNATEHVIAALRIYGRSYDEIKKYIDGLSYVNNITYNNENNLPTIYYKSYINNILGWNAETIVSSNDTNDITPNLFFGYTKGFDIIDAEDEFFRRLILSSKYIMKSKGTKNSIEQVMNLFGVDRDKYSIEEYVYKIDKVKNEKDVDEIVKYNKAKPFTMSGIKYDMDTENMSLGADIVVIDDLEGLCITKHFHNEYTKCDVCGGTGITEGERGQIKCPKCGGLGQYKPYCGIPYFKGNTEDLYYQQKGQWYQETDRNLNMVQSVAELYSISIGTLQEGDLYYVDLITEDDKSNYFVLKDIENFTNEDGWHNIDDLESEEIELVNVGDTITISINKLLEIKDNNGGNNPHYGNREYDNGIDYLFHYGSVDGDKDGNYAGLFRNTLLNAPECIHEEEQYDDLKDLGFKLTELIDTKKSWAVEIDGEVECENEKIDLNYELKYIQRKKVENSDKCEFFEDDEMDNTRKVGNFKEDYKQIINTKQVKISLKDMKDGEVDEFYNIILPYLEEVIPSSILLEIEKAS